MDKKTRLSFVTHASYVGILGAHLLNALVNQNLLMGRFTNPLNAIKPGLSWTSPV